MLTLQKLLCNKNTHSTIQIHPFTFFDSRAHAEKKRKRVSYQSEMLKSNSLKNLLLFLD